MIEAHAMERVGTSVTYGAGAAALFFGFTASEVAGLVAAGICILSYLTTQGLSAYFKAKDLELARAIDARHAAMERERLDALLAAMERNTIMHLPATSGCDTCPYNEEKT